MGFSMSLTTNHDLELTNEPVVDLNADGDPNTTDPDTRLLQTVYNYITNQSPTYPYSIATGNNLSGAFSLQSNATVNNVQGEVLVESTTVHVKINKAVLNVSTNLNT